MFLHPVKIRKPARVAAPASNPPLGSKQSRTWCISARWKQAWAIHSVCFWWNQLILVFQDKDRRKRWTQLLYFGQFMRADLHDKLKLAHIWHITASRDLPNSCMFTHLAADMWWHQHEELCFQPPEEYKPMCVLVLINSSQVSTKLALVSIS